MNIFSRKINKLKKSESLLRQIEVLKNLIVLLEDIYNEMKREENTEICLKKKLEFERTIIALKKDQIIEWFNVYEILLQNYVTKLTDCIGSRRGRIFGKIAS